MLLFFACSFVELFLNNKRERERRSIRVLEVLSAYGALL